MKLSENIEDGRKYGMEKFVEKFNIFDLFTMLMPGIASLCALSGVMVFKYYEIWKRADSEKYIVFFVLTYVYGLFLQEIGNFFDKKFLYKILYGGEPRKIFLLEEFQEQIWESEAQYNNACSIRKYLKKYIDFKELKHVSKKDVNYLMFAYCLNKCEMLNLTNKVDRMLALSEMARSLFWGCCFAICMDVYFIATFSSNNIFLWIEMLLFFSLSIVFVNRKKRFEQFYIRILIRYFIIYEKSQNKK